MGLIFQNDNFLDCLKVYDWFKYPQLIEDQYFSSGKFENIELSIVVPVHNKEEIIQDVLDGIFNNTENLFELILIFDACVDKSLDAVKHYLHNKKLEKCRRIVLISNSVPLFETACDNIGFKFSTGKYIIEIQSDIIIKTNAYDSRIISVLNHQNVFSVSGRCCHSYSHLYGGNIRIGSKFFFSPFYSGIVGLGGAKIESEGELVIDTDRYAFLGETNNRGPLGFKAKDLSQLGYFDLNNFFLGNDDHDLNLRASLFLGKCAAYVPTKLMSPLKWGSTRKKRDSLNEQIYKDLSARIDNSVLKRFKNFYRPFHDIIKIKI